MLKCGEKGTIYTVSFVKHELRRDQEVTIFSISDHIHDKKGNIAKLADGNDKFRYVQVTVWEDLPIVNGSKIRILYLTAETVFEMKNAKHYLQTYYSITAKVEIVKDT